MKLRAPCIPLITIDPYFSIWSKSTNLNYFETIHWTGRPNRLVGTAEIDGKNYVFFGSNRNYKKMKQISLEITALTTKAVFTAAGVTLTAEFTSALLPDKLDILTRPVSYLNVSYVINDGKNHNVKIKIGESNDIGVLERVDDRYVKDPLKREFCNVNGYPTIKSGNEVQKPLNASGDNILIDWGYFYISTNDKKATYNTEGLRFPLYAELVSQLNENENLLFTFAYDDIYSIEYFHKPLKSYWNNNGKTIETAITEAIDDYAVTKSLCDKFSLKLYNDAKKSGGVEYAEILSLAYRQVIAAHKVVIDENGEILFISKECFSNGCAATVDVTYPSIPMFLLYNPELVKGMLRPVYKYAESDEWTYDFAPHDVGRYPLVNGQVYGNNEYKYQMPVEECGNMLICEANIYFATGDISFAKKHVELLRTWTKYLLEFGEDPADQLCTDDFAGRLAHNCNLSLKAIMGIQAMSIIENALGNTENAKKYRAFAEEMATSWKKRAYNDDGSTRLTFDEPNSFSMKYNMVWDKIWNTGLFGQELMTEEIKHNLTTFNEYGMPLDSRADFTKSDWLVWVATMADNKNDFKKFISPMFKAYSNSETRTPLTDWYDTVSSNQVGFQHRSVQGGLFIKILCDKWLKKFKN